MEFSGKRVVVTGGSKGIGKQIVEKFLDYGANVAYLSRTPGERGIHVKADLTVPEQVESAVGKCAEILGGIDILVLNAGEIHRPDGLEHPEAWERNIKSNLLSHLHVVRSALKFMKSGSITFIGSTYSKTGAEPVLSYVSAKGGLESAMKSLAKSLAPKIRVNMVSPSNIMTEMTKKAVEEQPGFGEWVVENTPLRRFGLPEEIASAVLFLSSDKASYITGANLPVDGGFLLK